MQLPIMISAVIWLVTHASAPCFWPCECTALISMAIRGIGRNAVLLYSRADTVLCCVSLISNIHQSLGRKFV